MSFESMIVSFGGVLFTWFSVILVLLSVPLTKWSPLLSVAGSVWHTVPPVSSAVAAVRVYFFSDTTV